ncbi:MAG: peptide deformylase [bacterium]|jgi:peptide deformylase|nr:peptide deformylase [bacterium]MDD3804747.1 peptide deformylase [bacterium]MDD4152368.1 peptide deformylase [bacterium]MDD4558515.1 peptide deformylase [bacterium]
MAVLKILTSEDSRLRQETREVTEITPDIRQLIRNMSSTLYAANGVGLAATQVGSDKRIALVDIGEGLIVLINPEIVACSGRVVCQEGCLSIPGYTAEVERFSWVRVSARDLKFRQFEMEGTGLLAQALQHEIDHLDGVLYVDKADPLTLKKSGTEQ